MTQEIKHSLRGICYGIVLLAIFACSEEETTEEYLTVNTETIEISSDGGQDIVHIRSNCKWNVTMSQTDVATASPTQGEGDGEITIEMTPNTTMANRSVNMTIQSENKTHMAIVKIRQPKVDAAVDIDKTSFTFDGTGGNAILKISCNTAWEIRDIPSWLKFSSTSGYKDAEITITALPSNQATQRKAVLGVVAAEQARTYLIVTQERGISTRQVAVNQFVTLRQSAAFTFNQGEDVEWFIYDILPKETVESLDDQALSLQLHMSGIIGEQEPSTIYWDTGLEPGREYAICAISSDINDDEEPAPTRTFFTTPPAESDLVAAIFNVIYRNDIFTASYDIVSGFEFNINKPDECSRFHFIGYTENAADILANVPDVYFAYQMLGNTPHTTSKPNVYIETYQSKVILCTWAVDQSGQYSGVISRVQQGVPSGKSVRITPETSPSHGHIHPHNDIPTQTPFFPSGNGN